MKFQPMDLPNGEHVATYQEYIQSDYWTALKTLFLKHYDEQNLFCDCCGYWMGFYSELHHLTYNNLGNMNNEIFDVIKVCRECHSHISKEEENGIKGLEAVAKARVTSINGRMSRLEMSLKMHHEWKRLPATTKEKKVVIDELVTDYKSKGLLTSSFKL